MKVQNLNNSSRKTRKAIREAFIELLEENQELDKVSVTDIVKKAQITRSTFYTHYENIYEVAKEYQNETLDILINTTKEISEKKDIDKYFDTVFDYFKKNEEIYMKILSSKDVSLFTERINKFMYEAIFNIVKRTNVSGLKKIKNSELTVTFYINGSMDILINYFRKKTNVTLYDIKEFIKNMAYELFFI